MAKLTPSLWEDSMRKRTATATAGTAAAPVPVLATIRVVVGPPGLLAAVGMGVAAPRRRS
jgi:hypothetical protein